MGFDLAGATEEVFQSALTSLVGEIAKERARNLAGAAAAEVVSSTAEAAVTGFIVPLLRLLLRVGDETGRNINKLIQAPLLTGLREAESSLNFVATNANEKTIRTERLSRADFELARALSLLGSDAKADRLRTYIGLVRGLICLDRGAPSLARLAFKDALVPLLPILRRTDAFLDGRAGIPSGRDFPRHALLEAAAAEIIENVRNSRTVHKSLPDVQMALFLRALINDSPTPIEDAHIISLREGNLIIALPPGKENRQEAKKKLERIRGTLRV